MYLQVHLTCRAKSPDPSVESRTVLTPIWNLLIIISSSAYVRPPIHASAPCSGQFFSQSDARQKEVERGRGKENFIIQSSGACKSCKLGFRVISLFFHLFHQITRETALGM